MASMNKPQALPADERLPIPPAAVAGLVARFQARQAAERELATFLEGVLGALGIPMDRLRGFDDEAGALLLAPADD